MIRVATLNLRANANRWQERFPLVVDTLHDTQADVIGLQEVRLSIDQHHLICDALNARNLAAPYRTVLCVDWYKPHILANAILTRIPVLAHERIELPEGFRTAQRVTVRIDGVITNIVNTHLHHKPYRDERVRLQQLDAITGWLHDFDHPAILMGDMNAHPHSQTVQNAKQWLNSAYEAIHGHEPSATFPTPLRADEQLRARAIDYIFYDALALQAVAADLIGDMPHPDDETLYASDHYGLWADVTAR